MPFNWTVEKERQMLLLAICEANLKPTQETWAIVAKHLGPGISSSAVSQKYYKLKRESEKPVGTTSANGTPTKTEKTAENAPVRPGPGRPRKRKMKEEDDAEEQSGTYKRMRNPPLAPTSRQNGLHRQTKLEEGATHWASDEETTPEVQLALAQDMD